MTATASKSPKGRAARNAVRILLAFTVILHAPQRAATAADVAAQAPAGKEGGTLIFAGGGDNSGLWPVLFDCLEKKDGTIAVMTPSAKSDESARDLEELREIRPDKVKLIDLGDVTGKPESIAAVLDGAQVVWLDGGPWDGAGLHEAVWRELAAVLQRGGVVGGSSEGASILASGSAAAGFLKGLVVFTDPGLEKGANAFRKTVLASHGALSMDVDPSTALLVRGGDAVVVGAGFARFGSRDGGAVQTSELSPGEHFNLASRKSEGRRAKGTGAVRVAIYSGAGTRAQNEAVIRSCLADEKGSFAVAAVGPEEIRGGRLGDFDVLIQSGGRASEQADALGEEGREKIREFVRRGGGYVGLNAGSYFAAADRPYYLHLLNAKVIDREHWGRGKGNVRIRFTEEGRRILGHPLHTVQLQFTNCPLFVRDSQPDLPSYDELAIYETEISGGEAPQGVMKGASAMASAPYGKGRVFCSGPHPTAKNADWKEFLRRAVLWSAGGDPLPEQETAPTPAP